MSFVCRSSFVTLWSPRQFAPWRRAARKPILLYVAPSGLFSDTDNFGQQLRIGVYDANPMVVRGHGKQHRTESSPPAELVDRGAVQLRQLVRLFVQRPA
jgi:hypothetical protein